MDSSDNSALKTERIDVRGDGRIILYKRPGLKNPKWQARLRIPGTNQYKVISTRSSKQSFAESFATDLYDELNFRVKNGGSIGAKTFSQIFDEWENSVNLMQPKDRTGLKCGTVERVRIYALKYFGPMKIDEIKSTDFQQFWQWRKVNYNPMRPSNDTLGRERTAILGLFKFAERFGHISKIPDSTPPRQSNQRRPTFTKQEWAVIIAKMDAWVSKC